MKENYFFCIIITCFLYPQPVRFFGQYESVVLTPTENRAYKGKKLPKHSELCSSASGGFLPYFPVTIQSFSYPFASISSRRYTKSEMTRQELFLFFYKNPGQHRHIEPLRKYIAFAEK